MLSRSAQGLYWIGRYLKRAEHISRLMEQQIAALVDRPLSHIYFGWARLYSHLRVSSPVAALRDWSKEADGWGLADSFTLADDLTFTRSNEYSICSCFEMGRENARQIRHCVSSEMWICLNRSYQHMRDQHIEDIWATDPQQFYADVVQDVNTFMGVASATLYRDEGWEFLQIGRMIEHAQLMCSLLVFQTTESSEEKYGDLENYDWSSLLHCFQADEAYQHYFGLNIQASNVLNMLVTDKKLPNSVYFSLEQIGTRLSELGDAPGKRNGATANRFAGRLTSVLNYEWPDTEDKKRMIVLLENLSMRLHEYISSAWFNYEIDDTARI